MGDDDTDDDTGDDGTGGARRRLPDHHDEAAVRDELTRAFTVCSSCRRCVDLCAAFPRLLDRLDSPGVEDPGMLTPLEQDRIVDACHQCDRCTTRCPFAPGRHAESVDVAGLMTTAKAMQRVSGHRPMRDRLADRLLDPAGRVGAVAGRLLAGPAGVTAVDLPRRRRAASFSEWFGTRSSPGTSGGRRVVLVPSCVVDHQHPALGADAVEVLEAAGAEVELSTAGCCGAYWLQVGDLDRYVSIAGEFVERLAEQVRASDAAVVVLHPTCATAIVCRSPESVGQSVRADAEFVAGATRGVAAFVLEGEPPAASKPLSGHIVFGASCHGTSTDEHDAVVELLRRAGGAVTVVDGCPGVGGSWGVRHDRSAIAADLGARWDRQVTGELAAESVEVGYCPDAIDGVARRTGRRPEHAVSLIARLVRDGWSIAPGPAGAD